MSSSIRAARRTVQTAIGRVRDQRQQHEQRMADIQNAYGRRYTAEYIREQFHPAIRDTTQRAIAAAARNAWKEAEQAITEARAARRQAERERRAAVAGSVEGIARGYAAEFRRANPGDELNRAVRAAIAEADGDPTAVFAIRLAVEDVRSDLRDPRDRASVSGEADHAWEAALPEEVRGIDQSVDMLRQDLGVLRSTALEVEDDITAGATRRGREQHDGSTPSIVADAFGDVRHVYTRSRAAIESELDAAHHAGVDPDPQVKQLAKLLGDRPSITYGTRRDGTIVEVTPDPA